MPYKQLLSGKIITQLIPQHSSNTIRFLLVYFHFSAVSYIRNAFLMNLQLLRTNMLQLLHSTKTTEKAFSLLTSRQTLQLEELCFFFFVFFCRQTSSLFSTLLSRTAKHAITHHILQLFKLLSSARQEHTETTASGLPGGTLPYTPPHTIQSDIRPQFSPW